MSAPALPCSVVVPTVGRASLAVLLRALARADGPHPQRLVVVDDRPRPDAPLPVDGVGGWVDDALVVVPSGGRGPAAARNVGWRVAPGEWVAFVDDDVVVTGTWLADLAADLAAAGPDVAGVQGRIDVPLASGARGTDWERDTAGLADARWITADMAYRRSALVRAGGFDERFPRAFREDADLALRVGGRAELVRGRRRTLHPVRPSAWHASVVRQRGNADDALMRRLHGPGWQRRAGAAVGRRPVHLGTTAAALAAAAAAATGHRRGAAAAGLAWAGVTAEFAWSRIAPGPRTRDEVLRMVATSALIPPAASWHWTRGTLAARGAAPWPLPGTGRLDAVLLDTAAEADADLLAGLRADGVAVATVARRRSHTAALRPVGAVAADRCPEPADGPVSCAPLLEAARVLGVPPGHCAVLADTASGAAAGWVAGLGAAVLVPGALTPPGRAGRAALCAPDLAAGVALLRERYTLGTPGAGR